MICRTSLGQLRMSARYVVGVIGLLRRRRYS
jgi:hypothetical protein